MSNVKAHQPSFTLPTFLPSPEKSFTVLPSYAEALASAFAFQPDFPIREKSRSSDPRILQFVDDSAVKSEQDTLSIDSSDPSHSLSTSST